MDGVKKINRLILVGNGFDLSHGLKTRYNDFILWYLKTRIKFALEDGSYTDDLINIKLVSKHFLTMLTKHELETIDKFVEHFYSIALTNISSQAFKLAGWSNSFTNPFTIVFNSGLFQELINDCSSLNWVNIENHYFKTLKHYVSNGTPDLKSNIVWLNTQWKCLITHFEDYLKAIGTNGLMIGYGNILYAPINPEEFVNKPDINTSLGDTLVLNFNYTDTIDRYIGGNSKYMIEINHVHGKLNNIHNPLIFGFGDELDDDYLKFEKYETLGQFDYIKSFWYFKTSNYYDLIRFIDSNEYQIYVLGHSCGLSDRTMLNMIFEHGNCKSIKIFYHGSKESNNYTPITQEISRHFKDKPTMRRRIVSLDKSARMPQYDDK